MRITESQLRRIIQEELDMEENAFTMAAAVAAAAGKKTFKFGGEEHEVTMSRSQGEEIVGKKESVDEAKRKKKNAPHPGQYHAPQGSKRDKQLDATQADLASGDPERIQRAYRRRDRMEKQARQKPGFRSIPRSDTQKEGVEELMELIESIIAEEILTEELSKKTKATLRKKALKRGLTPGSVETEYKKGLKAFATSGSRPGMTAHQWAMARVNSATPSKSWATVKKSKRKKE